MQILDDLQDDGSGTGHHANDASDREGGADRDRVIDSLEELFKTISEVSGLEVCIYPPPRQAVSSSITHLPVSYRRHMSDFCRAAKRTHDGRGCRGHDSFLTNNRAAQARQPFVQVCHMGVAEVIVPIFSGEEHLGTVFIGQVVTPQIETDGFEHIWNDAKGRVTSKASLARGYKALPRMSRERLLRMGMLADAAIRGLADQLSDDVFARQIRLHSAPAVRMAVDILHHERCWEITASEMAKRVHLSPAHFSRLFHRIMDTTFSQYLTAMRIRSAQVLLHHQTLSIAQISQRCGFSRQSYFTRKFREVCGMTPSQYRANTHP